MPRTTLTLRATDFGDGAISAGLTDDVSPISIGSPTQATASSGACLCAAYRASFDPGTNPRVAQCLGRVDHGASGVFEIGIGLSGDQEQPPALGSATEPAAFVLGAETGAVNPHESTDFPRFFVLDHRLHDPAFQVPSGGLRRAGLTPEFERSEVARGRCQQVNRRKPQGRPQLGVLAPHPTDQGSLGLRGRALIDSLGNTMEAGSPAAEAGRAAESIRLSRPMGNTPTQRFATELLEEAGHRQPRLALAHGGGSLIRCTSLQRRRIRSCDLVPRLGSNQARGRNAT